MYIDGSLGGGGHTWEILKKGGKVLGIDVDDEALAFVTNERLKNSDYQSGKDIILEKGNFEKITEIAKANGFTQVSGILLDLGVSSHQFDASERGFSFQDGPLDMRMGDHLTVSAKDLVNGLTEKELVSLFERLGEERFAKKIAKVIVEKRYEKPFETTRELADLIKASVFRSDHDIHPATRIFQALRIAVNDELNVLRVALPDCIELLKPGGRLAVISFHSLEDRIVKHAFQEFESNGLGTILTKKPLQATNEEVLHNNRARSAKLRVFEKK